jgi:hypothetical protein
MNNGKRALDTHAWVREWAHRGKHHTERTEATEGDWGLIG